MCVHMYVYVYIYIYIYIYIYKTAMSAVYLGSSSTQNCVTKTITSYLKKSF